MKNKENLDEYEIEKNRNCTQFSKDMEGYQLITQPLRAQSHCGLKQNEMEMEEGSACVSWYERQLLIGPNHIFHRILV